MPAPGAAAKLKFGTVTEDYEQADLRAEIEAVTAEVTRLTASLRQGMAEVTRLTASLMQGTAEVTRLSGLLVLCDPVLGT